MDVSHTVQIPGSILELPNQHPDYTRPPGQAAAQTEPTVYVTTPTVGQKFHLSPSAFAKAFEANPFLFKSKEHNDVAKGFKTEDKDAVAQLATTTIRILETSTTEPGTTVVPETTKYTTTTTEVVTEPPILATPAPIIQVQHEQQIQPSIIPEPIDGLQPPHLHYKTYDDSTTEGPPIYYQWKWAVPAFVLEPPKESEPQSNKGE